MNVQKNCIPTIFDNKYLIDCMKFFFFTSNGFSVIKISNLCDW